MVVIAERKKPKSAEAHEAHVQASAMVEEQYQNFDVVWAKMSSFAWWPAVLFYSWDAVNEAGLDLKQVQSQLEIPPPTVKALPDGKERLVYSVLIMYLDKFNCSVVEVSPKTVCPFAINYERLHKPKKKTKTSSGFNIALKRALRLLHMNDHMTVEELDAVAPVRYLPTEEELEAAQAKAGKRQKRSHPAREHVEEQDSEDEEEEEEEEDGSDYTDREDEGIASSRRPQQNKKGGKIAVKVAAPKKKTMSKTAPPRALDLSAGAKKTGGKRAKPRFRHIEAIDDDEDESDFEIVNTGFFDAPAKVTASGKKASRKAGRVHHDIIDVDNDDDDECSGDFEIAVANHDEKKHPKLSVKANSSMHAKTKSQVPSVSDSRALSKPKKKKSLSDAGKDVEYVPKSSKKKSASTKRQLHDQANKSHHSNQITSASSNNHVKPLTLTPLSSIWTAREKTDNTIVDTTIDEDATAKPRLAYKLDLLWDEELFTDEDPTAASAIDALTTTSSNPGLANGERGAGKRQVRSVQQSQIRQSMMSGNLDPHTMVQCEAYLPKGAAAVVDTSNSRSRGAIPQIEAPFEVIVHPDAVFVCDLHSHLATCEIIGFLGGRWDEITKTLHIQAAFPCRSLEIEGDDGSTDVEMDPESEIELREIIQNAELEVVGWYHSHPAFAPDPSIRDIENQTSYQTLFQRRKDLGAGKWEISEPFVGLIVGTYDSRRDSPVGLFRYFHTRGERVNSGTRQEVHMPYELVPRKRFYHVVLEDERRENGIRPSETKSPVVAKDDLTNGGRKEPFDPTLTPSGMVTSCVARVKKRKTSTDLGPAVPGGSVPQSAKKRRGRQLKSAVNAPDVDSSPVLNGSTEETAKEVNNIAPPEVVDLISSGSQEPYRSDTQNSQGTDSGQLSGEQVATASNYIDSITQNANYTKSAASATLHNDDIVMIDESSQSELDTPGQASERMNENETAETAKLSPSSGREEMVIDSSQSQEDRTEMATVQQDSIDKAGGHKMQIVTQNDDLVSASTSSSSMSESSFSYDASQSQSLTQSQSLSQGDAPASTSMDEDDPYASIEVIISSEPPSSSGSTTSVKLDIDGEQQDPNHSDSSNNIKPNCGLQEVTDCRLSSQDESVPVQDDEVVGDSAPEGFLESASPAKEDTKVIGDTVVGQSRTEEESGRSSAASGGGSTPIDTSLVTAGRRRTRKPSLTMRRSGPDAQSSTIERTNVSPRSTDSKKSVEAIDGPTTGSVKAEPAESSITAQSPLEDRKQTSYTDEKAWEGVEVLADHHVAASPDASVTVPSVKPETILDPPEVKSERLLEPFASELRIASDIVAQAQVIESPNLVAVNKKVDVTQEQTIRTEFDEVPPTTASVEDNTDRSVGSRSSSRRRKSVDLSNEDGDILGILVEPLDDYKVKHLRKAVARSGLMNGFAPEDRNKKSNIMFAIREMWHKKRNQQPASEVITDKVTQIDSQTSTDGATDIPMASDETKEGQILFETKRVVEGLVVAVEAMVNGAVVKAEAPTSQDPTHENSNSSHDLVSMRRDADLALSCYSANVKEESIAESKPLALQDLHAMHLNSLRSKYGPGIYGCTEQVISLIDYYRDFHRRTDLNEIWKPRITKADKIEASLRADVKQVNLPVALRDAFIQDVMGYLRASWKLSTVAMK